MAHRQLHLRNPMMRDGDDKLFPKDVSFTQKLLDGRNVFKENYHPGTVDGVYGMLTGQAAHSAKWALGYPRSEVTTEAGNTLRGYLTGEKKLPLSYQVRRKLRQHTVAKQQTVREKIVANARWGITNERNIHYSMGSQRMAAIKHSRMLPLYTDCSAFVTLCYNWAGAPDPNGTNYSGYGFTGTLLKHCTRIPMSAAKPGDIVVFGYGDGHHACLVLEGGSDPLLASHGQEAGPMAIRFSEEFSYQRRYGPATFLRILP